MSDTKKFMLTILGEQVVDGERDQIEVITECNFMKKRDHWYIGYKEYDDSTPPQYYDNLIKVEKNTVTIKRKGPMQSQLILESGRRHQCVYGTPAGELIIGVYTKMMKNRLTEHGGTLEVSYTLDFNTDLMSENRFYITVEEKGNETR